MKHIIANWKMNKTPDEADKFFASFNKQIARGQAKNHIAFCVPFTCLKTVNAYCAENGFLTGAQNFYPAKSGAYTGEISAEMLIDGGVKIVLCGHSERRSLFNESNEFINEKVKAAIATKLFAVLCIGETRAEREGGQTESVLKDQLKNCLNGVTDTEKLVVAYEPVWAIGTGLVATSEQIAETHAFITKELKKLFPKKSVHVLYGGSANEKNAKEILGIKGVDGVLVGGASLDPDKFAAICNS